MRYMGNKRSLVRFILPEISRLAKPGEPVLDLFSGTCAVGYGLKRHHVVYTNDIQAYAEKIAEALLKWKPPAKTDMRLLRKIEEQYNEHMKELSEILKEPLETEESFFLEGVDRFNWGGYKSFAEEYPHYGQESTEARYPQELVSLFQEENIQRYHEDKDRFPYVLFSTYFANGYFGVRQAAQIDSLRYSIDRAFNGGHTRSFLLTCLISAASNAVSSTGHFAQFRNLTSPEVSAEVLSERRKDILTIFKDKFTQFSREIVDSPEFRERNDVFPGNHVDMFRDKEEQLKSVKVIYADPPYTPAQYSRFYHVLETLVRYDYPECQFVGRYRKDRERSDFCRYGGYKREFEQLVDLASQFSPNLAISYSNNGMFERISELEDIVGSYFNSHRKITFSYHHSRQGRPSKLDVEEYLVVGSQEENSNG